jgi:uncharacterized protein YjbI with pentapeptide repeats
MSELTLYMRLRPCDCGSTETSSLSPSLTEREGTTERHYAGRCLDCGRGRSFAFETPDPLPEPVADKLGPGASPLFSAEELEAVAVQAHEAIAPGPGALNPQAYFASLSALHEAIKCTNEALELLRGAARDAALTRRDDLEAKRAQHVAVHERIVSAWEAPERVRIDRELLRVHKAWLGAERTGPGRLVFRNKRLAGQRIGAVNLGGARFEACNLDEVELSMAMCHGIELVACEVNAANLHMSEFDEGLLENCRLRSSSLALGRMRRARVQGGDWSNAHCDRLHLTDSRLTGVRLARLRLISAPLDGAVFTDCDFREANLGVNPQFADKATTTKTRFVGCDFRGANFAGRRLQDTVFERCRFHGVHGAPKIEGPLTIIAPDLSEAGDGSEVGDAADVRALWGVDSDLGD